LYDERVSNDKADRPRLITARRFAHYGATVTSAKDISPVPSEAFWIESSSSPTFRARRVELHNPPISGWPTAPLIVAGPRRMLTEAM